ncbi:diguanylate cyclase domain-containing protein [Nocardia sp. CA-119907]|uniref:diguanylate cyclase domain-containing protein n=1 Tax=Nocardia sp. CA-119907 TaxID=3239973 RepID=UPI003D9611CA
MHGRSPVWPIRLRRPPGNTCRARWPCIARPLSLTDGWPGCSLLPAAAGKRNSTATRGQGRQAVDHAQRQACHAGEERFRIVFDNAAIAIAIADTAGILLDTNPGLAGMVGAPVEALRGTSVLRLAHPEDRAEIHTLIAGTLVAARGGTVKLERRFVRADASTGWASLAITYVKGAAGRADYLLAVGEDVTERRRLQAELRWQARHDGLTGLPNRRHLLERNHALTATAADHDRVGLCFVDLDGFKQINDRHGHRIGDQVLLAVATRLRESLPADDAIIARVGGDEFIVLVWPPADEPRITAVADRLISALATPITAGEHQPRISASIGAVTTSADTPATDLLDAADRAPYHAKTSRKDQWVLHTPDNPHTSEHDA